MNFKPHLPAKVLSGEKTQTRRIVKTNEYSTGSHDTFVVYTGSYR